MKDDLFPNGLKLELRDPAQAVGAAEIARALGQALSALAETLDARHSPQQTEASEGGADQPQQFTEAEIEVITLGIRFATRQFYGDFQEPAQSALIKLKQLMAADAAERVEALTFVQANGEGVYRCHSFDSKIRDAICAQHKIAIKYTNAGNETTRRTVWPFAFVISGDNRLLAAWCTKRAAIRHFRTDRIEDLFTLGKSYDRPREDLIAEWRLENYNLLLDDTHKGRYPLIYSPEPRGFTGLTESEQDACPSN